MLPNDRWWKISPFQEEMDATIKETVDELEAYGIAWLEHESAT